MAYDEYKLLIRGSFTRIQQYCLHLHFVPNDTYPIVTGLFIKKKLKICKDRSMANP